MACNTFQHLIILVKLSNFSASSDAAKIAGFLDRLLCTLAFIYSYSVLSDFTGLAIAGPYCLHTYCCNCHE